MTKRNGRRSLAITASAIALCLAAPGAFAQTGPAAPDAGSDRVIIVGVTLEETLPQQLEKYGADLETVSSGEIRNQVYASQDKSGGIETYDRAGASTVEVRGFELQGSVDFNNGFAAFTSYTDAESKVAGGTQLARIPRSYGKVCAGYDADQWSAQPPHGE